MERSGAGAVSKPSRWLCLSIPSSSAGIYGVRNTMMPKLIRGDDRAETEATARQILERVGLGHRLDHKLVRSPAESSSG